MLTKKMVGEEERGWGKTVLILVFMASEGAKTHRKTANFRYLTDFAPRTQVKCGYRKRKTEKTNTAYHRNKPS